MKLKFKQQQYQDDAVMSIVKCFEGQRKGTTRELLERSLNRIGDFVGSTIEEVSFGNFPITLSREERRNNIKKVQKENDIDFTDDADLDNFSIEMETGTGKTYTYIKTMYELNKNYGWSKFIVMVPSIAIREGVQKSFQTTQEHFQEIYHKKIRYFIYNSSNSSNIANINTFVSDDTMQVMIINYQAFSSRSTSNRRIYEELDELNSRKPIDVIKSVNPILIIDEPQKFGNNTERKFNDFNPLFIVRYSATHKRGKEYNKVYRLDAIDAYNQKLVKKINVKGIEVINNISNGAYLFLDSVDISKKHDPVAYMEIDVKTSSGVSRKLMKFKSGDNLYKKSGYLNEYKNYIISEIDARYEEYDKVFFSNGTEIRVGQAFGDVSDEYITRIQIKETIRTHIEKEKELYKQGIKVLSLFFIDEVAKYKDWSTGEPLKGEYAKIFEEEYLKALNDYRGNFDEEYSKYLDSFETGKIHAGYFSVDRNGHDVNSPINDRSENITFDEDAYDLIMKDKERLLSLAEPVRFIFSHSALREGWDNPNIFQICTLKHSNSEISKRQEIGRGLRICVNSEGERMDYKTLENNFHSVNTLTVIASESYDSFASSLQNELSESLTSRPKNFVSSTFIGKVLKNDNNESFEFTDTNFNKILFFNVQEGYVDLNNDSKLTEKFINDLESNKLKIIDDLGPFKEQYTNLLMKLYSFNNVKLINDERRSNIKTLTPNSNFMKKEFQDLWKKINIKTIYEVDFDTEELIDKSIKSINDKLQISRMYFRITEGTQRDNINTTSISSGATMIGTTTRNTNIDESLNIQTKYDLIGELTRETGLTRKTIIKVLSGIKVEKFNLYKNNPEEFIRKISKLINNEKATTVIDGITYHKTELKYSNDIFTINNVRGELGENAIDVRKHIYDFLITDSKNETDFAKKLEAGEVTVYAKLPSGFKIPTPVGNYNPDWAIVFDNPSFKYVYFIAETKGSMDSMELRDVEKAKIECARRHFKCLCSDTVKYDVVDSYESLINLLI